MGNLWDESQSYSGTRTAPQGKPVVGTEVYLPSTVLILPFTEIHNQFNKLQQTAPKHMFGEVRVLSSFLDRNLWVRYILFKGGRLPFIYFYNFSRVILTVTFLLPHSSKIGKERRVESSEHFTSKTELLFRYKRTKVAICYVLSLLCASLFSVPLLRPIFALFFHIIYCP